MDNKISALTEATILADEDLVAIVQGLPSSPIKKKMTIANFLKRIISGSTEYGGTILTNINTINKGGFYTCYGTATGVPDTGYSWFIIHQNSNAGTVSATQIAIAYNAGEPIIYERVKMASTWGNWYIRNKKIVEILLTDNDTALVTGDGLGKIYFIVPSELDGWRLKEVSAHVTTASTSGLPTFQIYNVTDSVDILSTALTIDQNEKDSSSATTPYVINASNNTLATGDEIRFDCDVAGTGTKGVSIRLTIQKI